MTKDAVKYMYIIQLKITRRKTRNSYNGSGGIGEKMVTLQSKSSLCNLSDRVGNWSGEWKKRTERGGACLASEGNLHVQLSGEEMGRAREEKLGGSQCHRVHVANLQCCHPVQWCHFLKCSSNISLILVACFVWWK